MTRLKGLKITQSYLLTLTWNIHYLYPLHWHYLCNGRFKNYSATNNVSPRDVETKLVELPLCERQAKFVNVKCLVRACYCTHCRWYRSLSLDVLSLLQWRPICKEFESDWNDEGKVAKSMDDPLLDNSLKKNGEAQKRNKLMNQQKVTTKRR